MVIGSLPDGWERKTIEEVLDSDGVFIDGDWVESKDQDPMGEVRLIQLADVGDGYYRNRSNRFLTHEKALELGCTFLDKGDLLIARMPDPLGRACIFPGDKKQSVTVVDVCIVRTKNADHRWLMYAINSPQFRADVESLQSGSTRKRISRKNLAKLKLPIPPLPEQERIVSRIEELFSDLEAGVAALEHVRAGLKRYKASVLKAACEGKLLKDEGELPEGWRSVMLSEVTSQIKDADHKMPKPADTDIPYVSTKDFIGDEDIDFENAKHISEEDYKVLTRKIKPELGDILLSRYGTVGQIRKVKTNRPFQASYSIAIVKPLASEVLTDFLVVLLRSEIGQQQMRDNIRASSQPDLGLESIRKFVVPLPPLEEQRRIVAEVERRLSVVGEVEAVTEKALARAARLRQSVLKHAFEGRL
ncbi:MAG: restriction endonuclease subunit S [Anaerolineales bacterium]|nr:restriction endonuclease subunit S [Anaerolineales bacterium]